MKKVLVGCLLFVFIAGIAVAAGGYFFVWRPFSSFVTNVQEFQEWEDRIDVQTPFTPPADGLLTEAQVNSFVAVYDAMVEVSGTGLADMQGTLAELNSSNNQDFQEVVSKLRELGRGLEIARQTRDAQVEAINAQGMSVQEYRWVRQTVMSSLVPMDRLGDLARMAQNGELTTERIEQMIGQRPAAPAADAPSADGTEEGKPGEVAPEDENKPDAGIPGVPIDPANSALVAPYRERAPQWVVLYILNF